MKRVSDIIKRPTLFRTGASLSGVKQGYIGNCWFCSLTASIANSNPGVIFDRIYPRTYNPHGFYLVRVYVDGHPYDVVVDDFIPTDEAGNAMFGRSEDASEIWFMIYEKAFAKLWGCYQFLVGGHPRNLGLDWASKLMARSMYWWKDIPHAPEHGTWADLNGHIEQGWSIVAATRAESHVEEHGLVSYHAYTVLATFDHQGDRLVVIRNPWGHGEWSGAWSDRDHTTQAQRYMLFNLAARDDGIFFIPMEDFCRNFGKLMFFRD